MKKWLVSVCFMALAILAWSPNARAASVDVDVDITLPSFLILYCYDDIAINITATELADALGAGANSEVTLSGVGGPATQTAVSGTITADMNIDAAAGAALTPTFDLVLQDTCGVRALASGGTATVVTTRGAGAQFLEAAGGVANGTIEVTSVTDSTGGSLAISSGLGTLTTFDVTMGLDLSNVVVADTFTDSGLEFNVTVTTP